MKEPSNKRKMETDQTAVIKRRWQRLNRLLVISGCNDDDGQTIRKMLLANIILLAWYVYVFWKQVLSTRLTDLPAFVVGNTITRIGNVYHFGQAIAAAALMFCASFRVIIVKNLMQSNCVLIDSLMDIDDHKKKQAASTTYLATVATVVSSILWLSFMMTGMSVVNIMTSESSFEILMWSFWWIVDMIVSITAGIDFVLMPCAFVPVALLYDIHVRHLSEQVDRLKTMVANGSHDQARRCMS